ncbi:helix-turn-helix domain-containing protein [Roseococcus suduntuyensis]|uniref:helix-turn-helix domain-containing protein n=1 Tax=Roseococcus suduntuyensis TaxID=455361 RepID=UPI0016177740|nr:helix-turn-helix transcriptional regulator [Roseococcus suduntuyensis]
MADSTSPGASSAVGSRNAVPPTRNAAGPGRVQRARRPAAEATRGARRADETDIELGQRLWQLRLHRGVTRREAAERLGVTAQQVQKYELGQDRLSIGRLVRLAALLETPLPVLIDGLGEQDGTAEPALERAQRHAESCALMQSFALIDHGELREMVLNLADRLARLPAGESGSMPASTPRR